MTANDPSETPGLGDPSDESTADLMLRALVELKKLRRASVRADRSRIAREARIPAHVFGALGSRGAIALPRALGGEHVQADLREVTPLGHQWLETPGLIDGALAPGGYVGRMNSALAGFAKAEGLSTEPGGREHILADRSEWHQNLWKPLGERKTLFPRGPDLHRWVHHLRSSQAFGFNLFGPLAAAERDPSFGWARSLWREWFGDTRTVEFEYPAHGDPLGETFEGSTSRTRVDVVLTSATGLRTLIEVKLTEPGFGACSAGADEDNPLQEFCKAPDWSTGKALGSCYLAKVKGRPYFERIPDGLVNEAALVKLGAKECPLRGGLYQLVRNLLMAREVSRDGSQVAFFVVAPGARLNPSLHSEAATYEVGTLAELLQSISRPEKVRTGVVEFEQILEKARALPEAADWVRYMEQKYLAALQAGARG